MVEKVAHIFVKKNFLRNSWKKWKKLSWPTFSTTQAVLEAQIVEKPRLKPFWRPKWWKKLIVENVGQDNFFHFFHEFLRKSLES